MTTSGKILGRVWIYDTGDPVYLSLWTHQLEPMELGRSSDDDWASRYFENLRDDDFRMMFNLPETGNYQVLFSGEMSGGMSGYEYPEWDEQFDLDEDFKVVQVPADFMDIMTPTKNPPENNSGG